MSRGARLGAHGPLAANEGGERCAPGAEARGEAGRGGAEEEGAGDAGAGEGGGLLRGGGAGGV